MAPTVARRFKTALEVVETSETRGVAPWVMGMLPGDGNVVETNGGFHSHGGIQNGWFIMENLIESGKKGYHGQWYCHFSI